MSDANTGAAANAAPAEKGRACPPRPWHVMLDLETLSTRKDAAVFQIAALCFDPETGETGPAFCAFVRPAQVTGHIDAATIAWWMTQKACADVADRWAKSTGHRPLGDFSEWLASHNVVALWSHGATFDIVVLENAYDRNEWSGGKPWSYRIERDTRTLYALAYADGKPPAVPVDETRKHDAAYDCEVQAQQVTLAWAALKSNR
jgi:exodeoxyribonuclease VIII